MHDPETIPSAMIQVFGSSGSACRCLLRLLELRGRPMSDAEFLQRFRPGFELWEDHPGMTDTAMICDIARGLNLARSVQVLRRYVRVIDCFRHDRVSGILVFTEFARTSSARLAPRYGCGLLQAIDGTQFELWTPGLDGAGVVERFEATWWDRLLAHALILA